MSWLWLLIILIIVAILLNKYGIGILKMLQDQLYTRAVVRGQQLPLWFTNLEKDTLENPNWREVLVTSHNLQVVAMNTPPGESLGWEVHNDNDQFFRVESGECELSTTPTCNGVATQPVQKIKLTDGMSALVPKGTCHNVLNTGTTPLRMYTIYGPPHHPPGTVDRTHNDEIERESLP